MKKFNFFKPTIRWKHQKNTSKLKNYKKKTIQ